MIQVENIVKRYGATTAVDHVSFSVSNGEIVGFLGPNGAGKSTTLKILTCYVVADEGKVSVGGFDVLDHSLEVRRRIGYLPETTPLYPDMEVVEYLRFVARARQVPASRVREALDRVVGLVGIERMLRKNIAFLSKGYKQRVGLAQALIHDPDAIILDEPTSGLDPHQIIEIRELIRELGKSKLVLLSSHILQEISAICTRIMVIKDGRIVANGKPEELQSSVSDREVYQVKMRGDESAILDGIRGLNGVDRVDITSHADGFIECRVVGQKDREIGLEISRLARNRDWDLAALSPQRASLEHVYLQLTAGKGQRELKAAG